MATIGHAELPVPAGGDAPLGPGALADLAAALDPHLVQHATDLADRNQRYADAPRRTLVTAADGTLWLKTSTTANVWATIYQPPPAWRPLSLASGVTGATPAPQILREGRHVYLRGRIGKSDDSLFAPGTGVKIADVPSDCLPAILASITASTSLAGAITIGAGRIEVFGADMQTSNGGPGSLIWFSQEEPGVPWIAIDGHYIID